MLVETPSVQSKTCLFQAFVGMTFLRVGPFPNRRYRLFSLVSIDPYHFFFHMQMMPDSLQELKKTASFLKMTPLWTFFTCQANQYIQYITG